MKRNAKLVHLTNISIPELANLDLESACFTKIMWNRIGSVLKVELLFHPELNRVDLQV